MNDLEQFQVAQSAGVAASLNRNFAAVKTGVETVESLLREAVRELHGEGAQTGCVMVVGTGLSIEVGNPAVSNVYWVDGERHEIDTDLLPLQASVPALTTTYVYLGWDSVDGAPVISTSATKTLPSGNGLCYLGEVTTDAESVTDVDVSEAETIDASALQATLLALEQWRALAQAAVGDDYFGVTPPATSLDDRLAVVEAGGGVGAETVKWRGLEAAPGDATTIDQQIDADVAAHVSALHGQTEDGDPSLDYVVNEYDVISANMLRGFLMLCRTTCPQLFKYLSDNAAVVWGVSGDGTDEFDHVDWVNSTWVVGPPA